MATTAGRLSLLVQSKARFLRFLERRLGSRSDAEDLLQEAFLGAVARVHTLRDDEKVIQWFYQLLRNGLVDHYRRRAAQGRLARRLAADGEATTGTDEALLDAVCRCVSNLVPTLRPGYAELIRRVELDGDSLRDAARELGLTPNNAAVRLHRARRALADALRATCGVCADHHCLNCACRREGGASHPPL